MYDNNEKNRKAPTKKKEPKDLTLLIRLSKSDRELLDRLSAEEDLPAAQIVRRAVKMYSSYYRP